MKKLKGFIVTLIATALGSGFTPKAPGTAGTVVGVFIIYLARDWSPAAVLGLGIFLFLFSVAAKIGGGFKRYYFFAIDQLYNLLFINGFCHVEKYGFQQRYLW